MDIKIGLAIALDDAGTVFQHGDVPPDRGPFREDRMRAPGKI